MSGGLAGVVEVLSGLEVLLAVVVLPVLDVVVVCFLKRSSSPSPEKELRAQTGGFINEGIYSYVHMG